MALPYPISASQTDAKSPVDDILMDSIRLDLDYIESQLATLNPAFVWNVDGPLTPLRVYKKAIDIGFNFKDFVPTTCRTVLKVSGSSGNLEYDIRKHTSPKSAITGIAHQLDLATQSIANVAPAAATQSIARSTPQINTQSISFAKATIAVNSIVQVPGTNKWRYNLASAPDADWAIGDSFLAAGCTAGGNNGTFALVEINQSGAPSVVVTNASGVAQTGAAGTIQLQLMSYNYTNPVNSEFVAGEQSVFASHTTGANNGTFTVYAVNSGGNNVLVKNATGVVQAGVAGTLDTSRWKYTYSAPVSATDFIVGEKAKMATHTTSANNGNFPITSVNNGGNNIVVYNTLGVAQAGVAGTANTNRWIYAMPSDPTASVTVGDNMQLESHTTPANNGLFTIKQINRLATNNLVFYNENGATQAGVAGNTRHTNKIVSFASDQSASITTSSYVELRGCPSGLYNEAAVRAPFRVLEVNRGGGSNFNIVINNPNAPLQASPAGYVWTEMKSIFITPPSIAADLTGLSPNSWVKNVNTSLVAAQIDANTPMGLYVTSMQGGVPYDLTVTLY